MVHIKQGGILTFLKMLENLKGFSQDFGRSTALKKLVNFTRGENPFFSIKRVFTPRAPRFPKKTTKGLAALWTLARVLVLDVLAFGLRDWDRY